MSFAESLEKLTEVIGRMYINGVKKYIFLSLLDSKNLQNSESYMHSSFSRE